jgi:hypothetical protein
VAVIDVALEPALIFDGPTADSASTALSGEYCLEFVYQNPELSAQMRITPSTIVLFGRGITESCGSGAGMKEAAYPSA